MIQQELWLAQLATAANTDYNTSAQLWKLYCQLLGQLLGKGEPVQQARIGTWQALLRSESVSPNQAGKKQLNPPSVELKLQWKPEETMPQADGLLQSLIELAPYTRSAVCEWWEAIPKLLYELLERGRPVEWEQIGSFVKELSQEGYELYRFTPLGELSELLNRPFSMFPIVELDEDQELADTPLVEESAGNSSIWIRMPEPEIESEQPEIEPEQPEIEPEPDSSEEAQSLVPEQEEREEEIILPSPHSELHEDLPEEAETTNTEDLAEVSHTDLALERAELGMQPSQSLSPAKPSKEERQRRNKRGKKILISMLALATLVTFGFLIYTFASNRAAERARKELAEQQAIATKKAEEKRLADSLAAAKAKALEPIGKLTFERGYTLARIALDNYGHRAFWVYIYEENKERIADPNNVALGTEIILPSPQKYGIDANDPEAVRKALDLQWKILK